MRLRFQKEWKEEAKACILDPVLESMTDMK